MANIAFSAPHHQVSQIGLDILAKGGSAIEAMVAAAAAMSVVYPHMNGLGGDSFWLIHQPGKAPVALSGAGRSAQLASIQAYQAQGHGHIPERGGAAALTVAGTLSGWQTALSQSGQWQPAMSLEELLSPAQKLADAGITVSHSLQTASQLTYSSLQNTYGFAACFLNQGQPLREGERFKNPQLANLFRRLISVGLDDFYRGDIGQCIAQHLEAAGSPLRFADLAKQTGQWLEPLSVTTRQGQFYNLPLPTQGAASLIIVALMDRCLDNRQDEATQLHLIVEATKQAFLVRDQLICDPAFAPGDIRHWLDYEQLDKLASNISATRALAWPKIAKPGDTVWMGCCDKQGRMVSFIQSLYWEFGSGVVIPELGLIWNNRGVSFSLDADHLHALRPNSLPFHTLNPALAHLSDGRVMIYGTMGGEGQPQTQAALLWRYLYQQHALTESLSLPRWLLGRTWGDSCHDLKIEAPLAPLQQSLQGFGHQLKQVPALSELMGHAGSIVQQQGTIIAAASDPRSDGQALISHCE
ncbi:gamma-glutamyltransferase family protein [Celerinatantimonas yamalensis]|uniref:Gamma-glutamyltransferase n=1 Tax=Celerinatantimonas yamalensis TaxID=559956 RepID=A0ABW9G900_9GAMM